MRNGQLCTLVWCQRLFSLHELAVVMSLGVSVRVAVGIAVAVSICVRLRMGRVAIAIAILGANGFRIQGGRR